MPDFLLSWKPPVITMAPGDCPECNIQLVCWPKISGLLWSDTLLFEGVHQIVAALPRSLISGSNLHRPLVSALTVSFFTAAIKRLVFCWHAICSLPALPCTLKRNRANGGGALLQKLRSGIGPKGLKQEFG